MKARYLLDTNIVIYIRTRRHQKALQRLSMHSHGEAVFSVISHGELLCGCHKSIHPAQSLAVLESIIQFVPVMPLPETTAKHYGAVRAELERRGERIGNNDLWIAAHALAAGLILVTNNEREFQRVPGLQIENWTK